MDAQADQDHRCSNTPEDRLGFCMVQPLFFRSTFWTLKCAVNIFLAINHARLFILFSGSPVLVVEWIESWIIGYFPLYCSVSSSQYLITNIVSKEAKTQKLVSW